MKILITLILLIIIFNFLLKNKIKFTKNNGFASPDANYILPLVYKNFITKSEADYIINVAKKSFKESEIIGGFDNTIRKSKTTWLYKDDPIIYNIIKKVCDISGYPIENAEPLQVVQ